MALDSLTTITTKREHIYQAFRSQMNQPFWNKNPNSTLIIFFSQNILYFIPFLYIICTRPGFYPQLLQIFFRTSMLHNNAVRKYIYKKNNILIY